MELICEVTDIFFEFFDMRVALFFSVSVFEERSELDGFRIVLLVELYFILQVLCLVLSKKEYTRKSRTEVTCQKPKLRSLESSFRNAKGK